jgi:hypothetical protein
MLKSLNSESLLVNGKIEMQLKVFIGTAWEAKDPEERAYVMDKGFKRPRKRRRGTGTSTPASRKGVVVGGLDLVAFQGKFPRFWLETKCSFFEHRDDGVKSARSALEQVRRTSNRLLDDFRQCPAYIVHFINSTPKRPSKSRPQFLLDKYPTAPYMPSTAALQKKWRESELRTIEGIYSKKRKKQAYMSSAFVCLNANPSVYAIVVKLRS